MANPRFHTVTRGDMKRFLETMEVVMASGPTRKPDRSLKQLVWVGGIFIIHINTREHTVTTNLNYAVDEYNSL